MRHCITNILLAILTILGIVVGALGSEILSLFGLRIPSLFTLILGLMMAWVGVVALLSGNKYEKYGR